MVGININCAEVPYVDMILAKWKTVETRDTPSLHSLIGKRVGLVETGKGIAVLKGYATIAAVKLYDEESWEHNRAEHCVPKDSKYDYAGKPKYGYVLKDPVKCKPVNIHTFGIKWRTVPEEVLK